VFLNLPSRDHIVPIKTFNQLNLVWEIPDLLPMWRSKPGHLFSHLLGHEGDGSILAVLKKKGWF
jgi:insulysin